MPRRSLTNRRLAPLAMGALLLVSTAPWALAADDENRSAGESMQTATPPFPEEFLLDAARARARYEQARERRATSEARVGRERSRLAHRGLDRGEALWLAKRAHREVFDNPAFSPWQLPPGSKVKRYIGNSAAVIEGDSDDDRALVESYGAPLTSDLGSGQPAPLDLDLLDTGTGFRPRNPAVSTSFTDGGRARTGGVGIEVASADPDRPLEQNGRLFYANALPDTDLSLTPLPTGVEVAFQVRSVEAPEQVRLNFDLPAGAELRFAKRDFGSAVDVVVGQEVVGWIHPPAAWDATGEPFPVAYAITGEDLIVKFSHRGRDLQYPLYVDPLYEDFGQYGWSSFANRSGGGSQVVFSGSSEQWLWLRVLSTAPHLTWVRKQWQVPRGYISNIAWGSWYHFASNTCGISGTLTSDQANWKAFWWACYSVSNGAPSHGTTSSSYNDWAAMQLNTNGSPHGQGQVQALSLRLTMEDRESPSVSSVYNSSSGSYLAENQTVYVTPTASDAGMGLWAINFYKPGGATEPWYTGCSGQRSSPCNNTSSFTPPNFSFNTNNVAEGASSVGGEAFDPLWKRTAWSTTVRVDRSNPSFTISGSAWDNRATGPNPPVLRGVNSFPVTVNASDAYSGVSSIEFRVDGQFQYRYDNPSCSATGCSAPGPVSWGYLPAFYSSGDHQVTVIVKDKLGHTAPAQTFWVNSNCY